MLSNQDHSLQTGRERSESGVHERGVNDAILLKPVQKRSRSVFHFGLLHHNHTLEVGVHATRPQVGSNCNVGVVAGSLMGVVDATEPLVEEVVKALVNVICLTHYYSVSFNGRVSNGCYCIDLQYI